MSGKEAVATTDANPRGPRSTRRRPRPAPRMFYYKLVYTVAPIDTQRIDSNLESGRYISRVGRARGFLSLYLRTSTVPTVP